MPPLGVASIAPHLFHSSPSHEFMGVVVFFSAGLAFAVCSLEIGLILTEAPRSDYSSLMVG